MNFELRRPLVVVSSAMVSQQVSGKRSTRRCFPPVDRPYRYQRKYGIKILRPASSHIGKVLYYSNDIFSRVLPDAGPYVSIGITLVNTLMTFPPIFLIDVGV